MTTTPAASMTMTPYATETSEPGDATMTPDATETMTPEASATPFDDMTQLPLSFLTVTGLSVEDFDNGAQQEIEQAVALVALGDASLSNYVDAELYENRRRLLQLEVCAACIACAPGLWQVLMLICWVWRE